MSTNVYTDANSNFACIAIEKSNHGSERRFDLIVKENKCDLYFEADAIRIALTYLSPNSEYVIYCDKQGTVITIQNGKSKNKTLHSIIDKIKQIESEKNSKLNTRRFQGNKALLEE